MTHYAMHDFYWDSLFKPVDKQHWIHKIASDYKGEFSEELLVSDAGEGILTQAVLTRDDVKDFPHLKKHTEYNAIPWEVSPGWAICAPLTLSSPTETGLAQAKKHIQCGTESLLVEFSPEFPLNTLKEFLPLLGQLNCPIHFRIPANAAPLVLSSIERPGTASVQVYDAPPALLDLDCVKLSLPHNTEIKASDDLKFLTLFIPEFGKTKQNSLGQTLVLLRKFIHESPHATQEVRTLLNSLHIVLQIGPLFFLEIARVRALRYLISRFVHALLPGYSKKICIPLFAEVIPKHSERSQNLIETSTRALSAIIGNCDTVMIRPETRTRPLNNAEDIRLAINAQLIIRHEARMDQVVDPGAGSYHIEWLTNQLIETAWNFYESTP